jgi:hypothetical protein
VASVFVLGPGQWALPRRGPSPLEIRKRLVKTLGAHHDAYILEPVAEDASDRDLTDKFYRTLRDRATTDVLIY